MASYVDIVRWHRTLARDPNEIVLGDIMALVGIVALAETLIGIQKQFRLSNLTKISELVTSTYRMYIKLVNQFMDAQKSIMSS